MQAQNMIGEMSDVCYTVILTQGMITASFVSISHF